MLYNSVSPESVHHHSPSEISPSKHLEVLKRFGKSQIQVSTQNISTWGMETFHISNLLLHLQRPS